MINTAKKHFTFTDIISYNSGLDTNGGQPDNLTSKNHTLACKSLETQAILAWRYSLKWDFTFLINWELFAYVTWETLQYQFLGLLKWKTFSKFESRLANECQLWRMKCECHVSAIFKICHVGRVFCLGTGSSCAQSFLDRWNKYL